MHTSSLLKEYSAKELETIGPFEKEFEKARLANNIEQCIILYNSTMEYGFRPPLHFSQSLLDLAIKYAVKEEGEAIWDSMIYIGYNPTLKNYIQKIKLYTTTLQLEKAMDVFKEIQTLGFDLDVDIFNAVLEAFAPNADQATLVLFFDYLVKSGLCPNENTFAILIKSRKLSREAISWYNAMSGDKELGYESQIEIVIPTSLTNELLLKATCSLKDPNIAFGYLRSFPLNTQTIQMYEILMKQYGLFSIPAQCQLLSIEMKNQNFKPTTTILEHFAICRLRHQDTVNADLIIESLIKNDVGVSSKVYQFKLRFHLKNCEFLEANQVFEYMLKRDGFPNESSLIDMICYICEQSRKKQHGLPQNFPLSTSESEEILIKLWNLYQPYRNLKYTRPVRLYRQLLDYYIDTKNLERSEKIFYAIIHDNCLPTFESTYKYAQLFRKKGDLKKMLIQLDSFIKMNLKRTQKTTKETPKLRNIFNAMLDVQKFSQIGIDARFLDRNPQTTMKINLTLMQVILTLLQSYFKENVGILRNFASMLANRSFVVKQNSSEKYPVKMKPSIKYPEIKPKRKIETIKVDGRLRFNGSYMDREKLDQILQSVKEFGKGDMTHEFFVQMFVENVEAMKANSVFVEVSKSLKGIK
jgi:predicted regulator of amino acid metabolism with ACT domain